MIKNYILFVFILIVSLSSAHALAEEQLIFSLDLIRHGDRTPVDQIPNSPIDWKRGPGELTEKGVHQEIQLGKKLRIKYIHQHHLLSQRYNPSSLYIRSTDISRTKKSAEALLLGLYPLETRNLSDQKISIHVEPINEDKLLLVKPSNNIYSLTKSYLIDRSFWKKRTFHLQDKLKHWGKEMGLPLNDSDVIVFLADNLYIRQLHHIHLPKGISHPDADEIISLSHAVMINDFKLKEVTYPMGHEVLKTVATYFELSRKHNTPLKYVLLSGHDASLMSVMTTLGAPLEKIPPYASRLNFSLMKNETKYYVKISYNDQPVYIPTCKDTICTMVQFHRLVSESSYPNIFERTDLCVDVLSILLHLLLF